MGVGTVVIRSNKETKKQRKPGLAAINGQMFPDLITDIKNKDSIFVGGANTYVAGLGGFC